VLDIWQTRSSSSCLAKVVLPEQGKPTIRCKVAISFDPVAVNRMPSSGHTR